MVEVVAKALRQVSAAIWKSALAKFTATKPWLACFFALLCASVSAVELDPEPRELEVNRVNSLCAGMDIEVLLPSGARADCVSKTHAIEVDYTRRWADAIGQSLHYASQLELLPGMVLVCHKDTSEASCYRHYLRVADTFSYWTISMTVWLCDTHAAVLADCTREEFWGPE
jgi:hypothetical protein